MHVIFSFANSSWYSDKRQFVTNEKLLYKHGVGKAEKYVFANAIEKSVNHACWKPHIYYCTFAYLYIKTYADCLTINGYLALVALNKSDTLLIIVL